MIQVIHKAILDSIVVALQAEACVPAVMLGGQPCGIGKRTLARRIASSLTKQVNHNDTLDNNSLSIGNLRTVVNWASTCPFSGLKIILLNCDAISDNGFNTLLKLLEEPPTYVRIILLYQYRSRIPITVFSRCTHFIIPVMTQQQVTDCLAAKGMLRQKAAQLAATADGSVTVAEQLMDLEGKSAMVIAAIKYLIDRQLEIFLAQTTKWKDELKVLEQLLLFVKRWQFRPFPMSVFPVELVATLARLAESDVDRILEIMSRPIRPSLKVFAFAEIISTGRRERF